MMVMDEVWPALCFGLEEREEGFINAYTCPLPACTGDASLSERNKNKPDVFFVFTPFPWLGLHLMGFLPVVAGILFQDVAT